MGNGRCGPHYGNTICPAGYCSKWWWCGTSKLHKSTHQARFDARPECMKKKPAAKGPKKVVKKPKVHVKVHKKINLKAHKKVTHKKVAHKKVIKGSKFAAKHKTVCHLSRNGRCGP